jgi:endonuclease YncB( thermonuclease family)
VRTRRLQLVTAAAAAILVALIGVRPGPAAVGPEEGTLRGTVVTVHDGDTIRVRLEGGPEETVRLIGVDSQELDDAREAVRFMAFLAKRFAFGRLYRAKVTLLPGPEARDSYGRLLAFVRTADGDLFNVTLPRPRSLPVPFSRGPEEGAPVPRQAGGRAFGGKSPIR